MKTPQWIPPALNAADLSVGDLLAWWRRGLLECLPYWARKQLDPSEAPFIVEVDPHGARLSLQREEGQTEIQRFTLEHARALLSGLETRNLVLRVPGDWVLKKQVKLPAAAKENLRGVVGYEMDRHTPFTAQQVFYDVSVRGMVDEGRRLDVEVAVLPRNRVKNWLAAVEGSALPLTRIDAPGLWRGANLLPPEERPRVSPLERLAGLLSWGGVLLLVAAVLVTPLWQKRQAVDELEASVREARQAADEALGVQERLERSRASLTSVVTERRERRFAVDVLKRVTELLPDDTWVQQFELDGRKLELRGMSDQATSLIGLIESAPDFRNAVFRSPVVQVRGQERFHLSAELTSQGEKSE